MPLVNTRKFKGLDSREITSLPEIKKVIYMARRFNHRRKNESIACSSQDVFAYNESLQHPEHRVAVLLTKILSLFRPLSSVHLFQKNQRFQPIKFVDRHVS